MVLPQAHRRRATLEFRAASPPVPALAAPSPQLRPPALRAAARYAPRSAPPPPPSGGPRARSSPLTIRVEAGAPITIVRSVIRLRLARRLSITQDQLGALQDAVIVRAWLARAAAVVGRSPAWSALRQQNRREIAALRVASARAIHRLIRRGRRPILALIDL